MTVQSYKKKDKNKRNDDADSSLTAAITGGAGGADPFDFIQLQAGISDALTRLKEDLQKLRSGGGGRLNPEVIEQLRVNVVCECLVIAFCHSDGSVAADAEERLAEKEHQMATMRRIEAEANEEAATLNTIPHPPGSAGRNYSIMDAMGLEDNKDTYLDIIVRFSSVAE